MPLAFLNPSRSFDDARRGIRFSGHDGMFEIAFFVEAAVLAGPSRRPLSEQQYLQAFDAMRPSIQDVAREMYANHHHHTNTLTADDFR